MRKDRWFRILKCFSKRCDFWKFSNLRKVLKYNCFQNITDSHKLNYFKILMFFLKNLLFERTHLLFENSSTPKTSSTFQKLIYFKKLIYFSETHLLQKTHLLLKNSSTFCQKEYLFKKSHGGKEKESDRFGLLFRVAFFCGKRFEEKHKKRQKKQSNEYRDPSQQIFTRDARAIFQENSRGRRILRQPQWTITNGGGSCAILMLGYSRSSIGAWQSSKVTIQYKHLKLLWAPSIGGKICLRISDISHWNFGELKSQNIAMKHEGHCMGLLRPTPFQLKFWGTTLHLCFPASPIITCLRLLCKFFVLENFLLEIWHVRLS